MTHITIPRFLKRGLLIGSAFAALVLPLAGFASAASASPIHLRPESFSIFVSTYDQHGSVQAFGPVHGFGTIKTPAPDLAVLDLSHPWGTVNVKHTPDARLILDRATCTESSFQVGEWKFVGGTGADWGATGLGHFTEEQFVMLKRDHHGQCEIYQAPRYFQVSVQAEGLAHA